MLKLLLIGVAVALPLFALTWAVCVRINNYGFLDAIWSMSVAILAPLYLLWARGDSVRELTFAALGMLWSLRLGLYILLRVWRHHPEEDRRYRTLRDRWPGAGRFLLFFELQALIAVIFSLPFVCADLRTPPGLTPSELFGLTLVLMSVVGEATADWQAQRFKRDSRNRDAVLNIGLWRYSRHPNYFFESLVWWGFAIAALDCPYGWLCLLCPMLMLHFLLQVTGIPLTEKHSLESRGEAYREYQRTTSRFIPWFKRKAAA